jgi:hypothetical protein
MKTLNLQDRCLAARTVATFERLMLLDEVWTSYLGNAVRVRKHDIAALESLTSEMYTLLDDAKKRAQVMKRPIAKLDIDWDKQFMSMINSAHVSRGIRTQVLRRVALDGGIRTRTLKALVEIVKTASVDQQEVKRKMQIIREGRYAPGDIRLACVIDAAGMGVGIAFGGFGGAALAIYSFGRSVRNKCWQ